MNTVEFISVDIQCSAGESGAIAACLCPIQPSPKNTQKVSFLISDLLKAGSAHGYTLFPREEKMSEITTSFEKTIPTGIDRMYILQEHRSSDFVYMHIVDNRGGIWGVPILTDIKTRIQCDDTVGFAFLHQ